MSCFKHKLGHLGWLCLCLSILVMGCSRSKYRLRADAETYTIIQQKSAHTPWQLPQDYNLRVAPTSRLYDPSPVDDPQLPQPAPQLYSYELPPLRADQVLVPNPQEVIDLPLPTQSGAETSLPPTPTHAHLTDSPNLANAIALARNDQALHHRKTRRVALRQVQREVSGDLATPDVLDGAQATENTTADQNMAIYGDEMSVPPIPVESWAALPIDCLIRMLEFESIREEYNVTREQHHEEHGEYPAAMPPTDTLKSTAPRLTLEDIMDLTLLNSRDYQSQKESLYRVALRLSLQRFDYMLKPSSGGNGTDVRYNHSRDSGFTTNTLGIPTTTQVDKMLATGGDIVARFANSVVLTFNGPSGFAADVGSDLIFDISQSILQRDILLESLTQAERNVIYQARDFARYRKDLFREQSRSYYALLNTYRNIEIQSQNYFQFIRSFSEREIEYTYGLASRYDADQLEISVLSGRNSLISTCNSLEGSLDNLKFDIGLPTETPINLNMRELEELTLRDELAVTGQLIERLRRRLVTERAVEAPSLVLLLSSGVVLSERMLEAYDIQGQLAGSTIDTRAMRLLGSRFRVDAARVVVQQRQAELQEQQQADTQDPAVLFLRIMGLAEELIRLAARQIELAENRAADQEPLVIFMERLRELDQRTSDLDNEFSQRLEQQLKQQEDGKERENILEELPRMVELATVISNDAQTLVNDTADATAVGQHLPGSPEFIAQMNLQSDEMLRQVNVLLADIGSGLVPVEVEMDDAMMTALVSRFDLINERGELADNWRAIKFAGDDLRSVLNLNATQQISTNSNLNRPFDFSFDDSQTSLGLSFDAPLNRRAQRNSYRESLINYQASLRNLMRLEDSVKLSARNDLRSLALDKETYIISVASAALSRDSVVSNSLQLKLGVTGVSVRDFRESQNSYTRALINVARDHIDYINDRTQLFFDLELLTVGDDGFWNELYNEDFQPDLNHQLPEHARPAYGELPPQLRFSPEIKRMNQIPTGTSLIHGPGRARLDSGQAVESETEEELQPVLEEDAIPAPQPPPDEEA